MGKSMWLAVGIFFFGTVLWMSSLWMEEEKAVVSMKTGMKVDRVKAVLIEKEKIIKYDSNRTSSPLIPIKKKELKTSFSSDEYRGASKEEFMERVEERRESLARDRDGEALEIYYEKKERREEKIAKRKARKEASKAYGKAHKKWRMELKEAKAGGDENRIRTLRENRPRRGSRDERSNKMEVED